MGFQNFLNFRRIFGEKKTKESLVLRISRYSILEVRYDILFDTLKVSIYRHSIISRYDKLSPECKSDICITFLKKKKYYHLDCPPQSSAGQECPSILVLLQDLDCLFSWKPSIVRKKR